MRPFERTELIIEIIKHLVNEGYICPIRLSIGQLQDRVSEKEQESIPSLVAEMDADDDIPLNKIGNTLCVPDARKARDFVFDKGGLI